MFQFFGCGEKPAPLPVDTAVEDTANEPASEPGTEPTGTDEDGDGFTVEDGDCDDTSPWINPARDEETGDGVDNDCDGRIESIFWLSIHCATFSSLTLFFRSLPLASPPPPPPAHLLSPRSP